MATYIHDLSAARGPAIPCDELSLSQPARVRGVHDAYLVAGADIVRTNTFGVTAHDRVSDAPHICRAAARLARDAADSWSQRTPDRPRFVAGTLGPPDGGGAHERIRAAYRAPVRALLDGGVDLLLFETCFHPAQIAAALAACVDAASDAGRAFPVLVSMVLDARGRLSVSGASIDDGLAEIDPAVVVGLGINCGPRADGLADALDALRPHAALVTCHPSAGLPDSGGRYPLGPDAFARDVGRYAADGRADITGGCCGTTPAHVAALARAGTQ
jgi:5-methyltetrahydrofolate--homocysteine methyltransferase